MKSLLLLLAFAAAAISTPATDKAPETQKYTAVLIWGTDGKKPEEKDLKDVEPELVEKFKNIFKWSNYFEVTRKDFDLKAGKPENVVLSAKCEVKLHLTQNEGMEVELFGEKKSVYKGRQSMPLKDILILAGDDKNATAWFVVLKPRK